MSDDITNESLYKVLKSVQAQVSIIREDMSNIKARISGFDSRLATLHQDMALHSDRIDRVESRLKEIENKFGT